MSDSDNVICEKRLVNAKKVMADGTVKDYQYMKTFKRKLPKISDENKAEIIKLLKMKVPMTVISKEYGCSTYLIKKIKTDYNESTIS